MESLQSNYMRLNLLDAIIIIEGIIQKCKKIPKISTGYNIYTI